jgi:hypothetical protein
MGRMTVPVPPVCTDRFWLLDNLPPGGFGPTPTESRVSWRNMTRSDSNVTEDAIAQTLPKDYPIGPEVLSPISPYSGSAWCYQKLSMTNEDAWNWSPEQVRCATRTDLPHSHSLKIKEYMEIACLRPDQTSTDAKNDLKRVWFQIVVPALLELFVPFIILRV